MKAALTNFLQRLRTTVGGKMPAFVGLGNALGADGLPVRLSSRTYAGLRQRPVEMLRRSYAQDPAADGRTGHLGGTVGNRVGGREYLFDVVEIHLAQVEPDFCLGRHHIGLVATFADDVMRSLFGAKMLPPHLPSIRHGDRAVQR